MTALTLKHFKAIMIDSKVPRTVPENIARETIKRGFVFSSEVASNFTDNQLMSLISEVEKEIGLTPEKLNKSFHKSWAKIRDASMHQLVLEQIVHYITTYGFESWGIYDGDTVYIPSETLNIPEIDSGKVVLTVIRGLTRVELKNKLIEVAASGIALKEDTVKEFADMAIYLGVDKDDVEQIKNKELKVVLYEHLDIVPAAPVEFLRYAVYKSTNTTLLIKNLYLKNLIHDNKDNFAISKLFDKYAEMYGLEKLAEIFFRYKPIFLAFKTNSKLNKTINKIRKLANKHHKPSGIDFLSDITRMISNGEEVDLITLQDELKEVNIFRKIRLAYALNFRLNDPEAIVYKVRNGKAYATEFAVKNVEQVRTVLGFVVDSIAAQLNVKGKKIFIPDNVSYVLPSTEKQFTGNVPAGSYISVNENMVAGVYWENVKGHRIDLDLSLTSIDGKIGWDRSYRSSTGDVLFSGDLTDASKGAAEHFFLKNQNDKAYLLMVNYFNFMESVEVPFKIIVARGTGILEDNHMVNPNDLVAAVGSSIKQREKTLGLIVTSKEGTRFYFTELEIGKSITSRETPTADNTRKYLMSFFKNGISLKHVLTKAGAEFVTKEEAEIDLSIESLEKDSILNLLK